MSRVLTISLFLLFALSPSDGGTIEFPGLAELISECTNSNCALEIRGCTGKYGEILTTNLKGCIVQKCKHIMISCMDEPMQTVLSLAQSQHPQVSFEVLKSVAEIAKTEVINVYLQCWLEVERPNTKNQTKCFLDKGIDKVEKYIRPTLGLFLDNPAMVSCWLVRGLRSMVNCFDHLDDEYLDNVVKNSQIEMSVNMYGYILCQSKPLEHWKNGCDRLWTRVFAATPSMKRQAKDLYVCLIDGMASAMTTCI